MWRTIDPVRQRKLLLAYSGIALALSILSIFLPWWTVKASGGGMSESGSARPFDKGDFGGVDMIESGDATTAGLFVLAATAALGAGFYFQWIWHKTGSHSKPLTPWLVLAGAAALALATLVAATTWPGEEASFFDSKQETFAGVTVRAQAYGSLGWFAAIASALLGGAVGLGLLQPQLRAAAPPPAPGAAPVQYAGPASAGAPTTGAGAPAGAVPPPGQGPAPSTPAAPAYPAPPGPAPMMVRVVQCPKCGSYIQPPNYRPVDLMCSRCHFTARLEF